MCRYWVCNIVHLHAWCAWIVHDATEMCMFPWSLCVNCKPVSRHCPIHGLSHVVVHHFDCGTFSDWVDSYGCVTLQHATKTQVVIVITFSQILLKCCNPARQLLRSADSRLSGQKIRTAHVVLNCMRRCPAAKRHLLTLPIILSEGTLLADGTLAIYN